LEYRALREAAVEEEKNAVSAFHPGLDRGLFRCDRRTGRDVGHEVGLPGHGRLTTPVPEPSRHGATSGPTGERRDSAEFWLGGA